MGESARLRSDSAEGVTAVPAGEDPDEARRTLAKRALAELARRELERRRCRREPAYLLQQATCVDSTTGEQFVFQLLDPDDPWYWQRELLDDWLAHDKHISLKARQLGITWLAGGLGLWTLLYMPGSKVLVVSIKEPDAIKVVNRIWDMLQSLPPYLWCGAEVLKPARGVRPSETIELRFPDGRISTLTGLTSTASAGHGETAALVILDEYSRHPYAEETWKAALPTTQGGGKVLVISTGNGRGSNYFYHCWTNADEYGLKKRFLPWSLHPDRDETWYRQHAEAMRPAARGEQYPRDEREAFILTGRPYFDVEDLNYYRDKVGVPEARFDFKADRTGQRARRKDWDQGLIRVYQEPQKDAAYAIGADVATGRGQDYSAAYVVRLDAMCIAAEFHGKLDSDLYAEQLHFLGRLYNTALIAVETGGGYGDSVIVALRDGKGGRPPYPRLYQHRLASRPDLPIAKPFGFPMNTKTRPLVINQLEQVLRDRSLPWLTQRLLDECETFIEADTLPSPRAMDGCNDDCVMALAITLEMYRWKGSHPRRDARLKDRVPRKQPESLYPWQEPMRDGSAKHKRWFDKRYPKEGVSA